jgi:uncharacterized protein YutE (UPF0331/DUF86 family)
MVDRPKIEQMLTNLTRYVRALRELASVPRAEFLANSDKIGSAKYNFVVAIECCIDIANHVIASQGFRLPKDNPDSFAVLVEQGVCPQELRERLRAMARFRNRLVHLYWDVDDQLVFQYLQESLNDFDGFAAAVAKFAG